MRSKIIILTKDNETKAVGSSCVKDFTGHKDVEKLLSFMSYLDTFDVRDKMDNATYGKRIYATVPFLELCAQAILEFNYKKSNDESMSTKDYVLNPKSKIVVSEEAIKLVVDSLDRVKKITTFNNDFERSLNTIANSDYIYSHQLGIASYLVEYHRIKVSKEIEKAKELEGKANDYVGQIKDRMDFELTYIKSSSFDTQFGTTYFHNFEDENGNSIVWKGSKSLFDAYNTDLSLWDTDNKVEYNDSLLGKKIKLKGTVTAHKEFRQRKQTIINRCKVLADNTNL